MEIPTATTIKTGRRRARREGISNRNRRRILESIHVNLISTLTALFIIQIFPNAMEGRERRTSGEAVEKKIVNIVKHVALDVYTDRAGSQAEEEGGDDEYSYTISIIHLILNNT